MVNEAIIEIGSSRQNKIKIIDRKSSNTLVFDVWDSHDAVCSNLTVAQAQSIYALLGNFLDRQPVTIEVPARYKDKVTEFVNDLKDNDW